MGTLYEAQFTCMIIFLSILLRMRNVSGELCRENPTILFLQFFFLENRAVYDIEWINMAELDKPQNTIWHMHISFWTPKATIRLCKTYCF
jgi:hypothetical protein